MKNTQKRIMGNISKKQRSKQQPEENEEYERQIRWNVHIKWTVGVLVFLLIGSVSFIIANTMVDGEALLRSLNTFSTILSIVLSVSSIAFAAYTSIETGRQFHLMSRAVEEIRVTNRIMSDNYKDLLGHYHDTVQSIPKLLNNQLEQQSKIRESSLNVIDNIINSSENENGTD